jgi:hypothetical protein
MDWQLRLARARRLKLEPVWLRLFDGIMRGAGWCAG